jgi:hypothetical protein
MAEDARTVSEMSSFVLVHHLLHAVSCKDVALVNKPIQQFGGGLDDRHVRNLERVLLGRFDVKDHLERLFVEGHERVEAREVEVVFDKILAYFGKVLVPGKRAEPGNPRERLGPALGRRLGL